MSVKNPKDGMGDHCPWLGMDDSDVNHTDGSPPQSAAPVVSGRIHMQSCASVILLADTAVKEAPTGRLL